MSQKADAPLPSVVPELLISDLSASLAFWSGLCGFEVLYERPEEGFALVHRGSAHFMLDQIGQGRDWVTGTLQRPFGRGVNFEISVDAIDDIVSTLDEANWPLFLAPETKHYRTATGSTGVRQFLVQDPDGYLLRFSSRLT
ncbi:bleomycin resistance protein [Mycetocola zhadangensis]|uniref:Bleomycin resistance protein n=1 Tax=Mycetocola zhadangensis TaxID=1164595 RepID=A0A3L7J119_9MICO|nr:VOC family protein [Mycetocola zhadangensis]RLQ84124.1 VOC family protein [Mycetocola zhadangensis]GGE95964.1 aldoketomutase [Mycetocola zhadangensis]